ncbi:ABC transporter ATP-binding protein [Paludibacterium yongneupense]|uniref:ABC transporter ATP-binding protein n=1 Tax=Paludibacterium yongneupense TaxID=400061 RepID=UPI0004262DA5|nr:ABC transporter ATP-binding protein [Paludibacterium yongneupense]
MLELHAVSVELSGSRIVSDVALRVGAGQTMALLGRNGAGKSTLVKALAGLLPYAGRAMLDGKELACLPAGARGAHLGYVAQDPAMLAARLTVFELLLLSQNSRRLGWSPPRQSFQRADDILGMLGISGLAAAMPMQLSGGQRQMVALALALVNRPRLLLLDEPTSALDLANQFHLLDTVERYTRRNGIATLMVLHDLNLASRYADRSVLLEGGEVRAQGATGDVLTGERLAQVYGVHCHIVPVAGRRAIIPVELCR